MAKKTYGISLNDANPEDAALMAELDRRGNASTVLRAALKLLLWGEAAEPPAPTEDPIAKLLTVLIDEQRATREETVNAIRSIQVALPLEPPKKNGKNGNGHHADDREPENDPLVQAMAGIKFEF